MSLRHSYHSIHELISSLLPSYDPAIVTYNVEDFSRIKKLQEQRWPEIGPGPGRAQEHSRPHQTYIDPTERYLIAVDCGADRIHVFSIGADHQAVELGGLDLPRPSFPRHVAMVVVKGKTMMYILNQDICTLATYRVEYLSEGGLCFHKEGEDIDLFVRNERVVSVDLAVRPTASHMVLSVSYETSLEGEDHAHILSLIIGS